MELPRDDYRLESRYVVEDSIRIVGYGDDVSDDAKVRLWKPFVVPTLKELHKQNKAIKRSFGIVKPDPGSVKFFIKTAKDVADDDHAMNQTAYQQVSMFEAPLAKLPTPDSSRPAGIRTST
jgi:hypothetical protein